DLAAEVGTPFYCYSSATLERHYRVFAEAFAGDEAGSGEELQGGRRQHRARIRRARRRRSRAGGSLTLAVGGRRRERRPATASRAWPQPR
ncbi:hypothetical protein FV228_30550, partial [Methylobacterium sp. WL18]